MEQELGMIIEIHQSECSLIVIIKPNPESSDTYEHAEVQSKEPRQFKYGASVYLKPQGK